MKQTPSKSNSTSLSIRKTYNLNSKSALITKSKYILKNSWQAFKVAMVAIKQRNKRPFQEIERIRDALNDSILSTIFQNIFWLSYQCAFRIQIVCFSYRQAGAIWFWRCLLHINYIPNPIVGAIISELAPSDIHREFESGAGQTNS
jgi:hypothetical protein